MTQTDFKEIVNKSIVRMNQYMFDDKRLNFLVSDVNIDKSAGQLKIKTYVADDDFVEVTDFKNEQDLKITIGSMLVVCKKLLDVSIHSIELNESSYNLKTSFTLYFDDIKIQKINQV